MKEITFKEWKCRVADFFKVSPHVIDTWLNRKKLEYPNIRKVNSRVIYVRVP